MEDYDMFIQRRLSQMRREEEEDELRPSASVIRFHGRPVLPPLLSRKQREEMQRYREEAKKAAAVCTKSSHEPRLARVQNLLHSVQLRTTPTLDQLLQEPEIAAHCLYSHNTSNDSVPQSDALSGTKDSLSPPAREENSRFCLPPLTSTTYSAFFSSDSTTQQTQHEGCLIDQLDSQQESQPSSFNGANHQSLSSGYVTNVNVENSSDISGRINAGIESPCFDSSQGVFNMGGSSQLNTSSTIAKIPELISYPPVDGEELEKSGLEMSFCCNINGVKDRFGTSLEKESTTGDHFPSGTSVSDRSESIEHEDNVPCGNYEKDEYEHEIKESHLSQTCQLSATIQQQSSTEQAPGHSQVEEADSSPSEEPHRLSVQALLKKSQEYRRRQRILRNQAKNAKNQERTQEEPRARTEEQNLSDKENDEFSHTGAVTAEVKKTKERRGTFIPSVETSTKKSWDNDKMVEGELISERISDMSDAPTRVENKDLMSFEKGSTFRNNQLNVPQKIITSHKQSSAFTQQQPTSAEVLNVHDAFYLTTGSTSFHKGPRKHRTVPVPQFCRSPTLKSKVKTVGGEPPCGNSTFNPPLTAGVDLQQQNSHAITPSAVSLIVEGDVTSFLAKSSQNIDQLESNLSILKVLISDLESTVKENNTQSESSFTSVQPGQSESDFWEDKLKGVDGTPVGVQLECPGRQSLNQSQLMKMYEHLGPDLSFTDVENLLLMYQEKGETVNELRRRDNQKSKELQTKTQHGACQPPPSQDISSTAQRTCIPNIFPTSPAEPDVSVLSDTSNRYPVEKRHEVSVGAYESVCSPLNLSYDVDTPSGLWLHEGSGSSVSSQGHLVQGNSLTPESRVEGEEGASKVKRRLLMHMSGESMGGRRAAEGSPVRTRSPRAATAHGREASGAQEDKQEQLKEIHAAQVSALQDEHRKQQEGLLQALAERYRLLRSVSFSRSMSSLHLGDTVTFSTPSMPSPPLPQHYRPLLAAAAKGFLTRRLLRTERVAQLVRTIRDTQQFLHSLQQQLSPAREFCSRQDLLLQERVCLQLRAARYEIHDVFFSLSVSEQMQMISWDRDLARERQRRRQSDHTGPSRKSSLSAATQKSLERKRGVLIQKKAAEMNRMVRANTRHKTGISAEQLTETKRGQLRGNPKSLSKSPFSSGRR